METLTKKTRAVGTSAGVILPKNWMNKKVTVSLHDYSEKEILEETISILSEKSLNTEAKGIYLFGSYARNDQEPDSDIDVLVITEKTNKTISRKNFEILLISEENFSKNLKKSLFYQSILKELNPLLNEPLIKEYSNKIGSQNFAENLKEIEKILKINEESVRICKDSKKNIPDGIVYSLVLRLRELYLIKCIKSKKPYSKKSFAGLIGNESYSAYLRIKRNEKELEKLNPEKAQSLIRLSKKWLKEIKG